MLLHICFTPIIAILLQRFTIHDGGGGGGGGGAEQIASSRNMYGMLVCKGILFFKWLRAFVVVVVVVDVDVLFCEYSMDKIKHQMENGRIFENYVFQGEALAVISISKDSNNNNNNDDDDDDDDDNNNNKTGNKDKHLKKWCDMKHKT